MAVVQSKAGGVLGTAEIHESFTSNVTKGNTLVACQSASRPLASGDETSIADSIGTKWRILRAVDDSGTSGEFLYLFSGVAPATGANTITSTLDANPGDGCMGLVELSGREPYTDPVRGRHNTNTNNAPGTGANGVNAVGGTPAGVSVTALLGDDIITFHIDVGALRTAEYTAGTGFTEIAEGGNVGANILDMMIQKKENVSAGSTTPTATAAHNERVITFIASVAAATAFTSYTTSFAADEDPYSDSDKWALGATEGIDWGDLKTVSGNVLGKLATTFHDNTGCRRGTWPNDLILSGTAFVNAPNTTAAPEIEFKFRQRLFQHFLSGYEVGFSLRTGASAYLIIVRWNGPVGGTGFDYLFQDTGSTYQVNDGDALEASLIGTTIVAKINGVQKATADIVSDIPGGSNGGSLVWTDGAPGLGINCDTGGSAELSKYGFKDYTIAQPSSGGVITRRVFNPLGTRVGSRKIIGF